MYAMPTSVAPGARIAIFNADSVGHTLTITSAGIDVNVDAGTAAYMTAPKTPGHYLVTCDFHADMTATLVVR
jgi:plastocyanin